MQHKVRFAVILFAAFAISAPALAAPNWPDIVTEHVAKVRKTVQTTDMQGYLAVVKNANGALLLDVREPAEFAAGHVPGAVNIPRGLVEFQIYKQLGYPNKVDTSRTIYVQCATGGRATLATAALKDIGFEHPIAVIMDWPTWVKDGNPTEK